MSNTRLVYRSIPPSVFCETCEKVLDVKHVVCADCGRTKHPSRAKPEICVSCFRKRKYANYLSRAENSNPESRN